ncbi:MAG: serine/threonine protein kinase [Candidatus Melainabacteria bacterium]|nr:serine/threonine protein kinase [Candidatus Melainabacteria bacterium]
MEPPRQPKINIDDRRRRTITRAWGNNTKPQRKTQDIPEGTIIGGAFQIAKPIGRGGMGTVYEVNHLALGRKCALKILSPELVNEVNWKRFQKEAKAIAGLSHPSLVHIYDLGIHNNRLPFYAMDLLKGEDLETRILKKGPLNLIDTVKLVLKLLDGIAYAHKHGIIHRDLKPANILLTSEANGEISVKILDFGIAKLAGLDDESEDQYMTSTGEIFGSPFYMSPEQCMGEAVDTRSDIYSIGCTLYEMLTGQVPLDGGSPLDTVMLHLEELPKSLSEKSGRSFPKSIETVVARSMAKLPQDRYQSAQEMAEDLKRILAGKDLSQTSYASAARSKEPNRLPKSKKKKKRNEDEPDTAKAESSGPWILAATVLISMVLMTVTALSLLPKDGKSDESNNQNSNQNSNKVSLQTNSRGAKLSEVNRDELSSSFQSSLPVPDTMIENDLTSIPAASYKNERESKESTELVFDFPTKYSIGTLNYAVHPSLYKFPQEASIYNKAVQELLSIPITARGRISIDKGIPLAFTSSSFNSSFAMLTGFQPNDLFQLTLSNVNLSNADLKPLTKLKGLRGLVLRNVVLNDSQLGALDQLTNLRLLALDESTVATRAVAQLKILNNLTELKCSTDEDFPALLSKLKEAKNLTNLTLTGPVSAEGLALIQDLGKLRCLQLDSALLKSQHLETLGSLKNIEELTLYNCASDNANLKDYGYLKNLKELIIAKPVGLHRSGCSFIKKQLPSVKVVLQERKPAREHEEIQLIEMR